MREWIVYSLSKDRDVNSRADGRKVRIHATYDAKIVLCKSVPQNEYICDLKTCQKIQEKHFQKSSLFLTPVPDK